MSLSDDVDLEEFITMKDDLSGADIKAVCTEAGLLALRERRMRVTKQDFTTAREKVCFEFHVTPPEIHTLVFRYYTGRTRAHQKACTCRLVVSLQYNLALVRRCLFRTRSFFPSGQRRAQNVPCHLSKVKINYMANFRNSLCL